MNMAIFGLFSFNLIGLQGAVLLMIAHGLTSGALFLLIGLLYERFKTRLLVYYGGLFLIMPIYSFIFIFFSFANVGFPGTINFSAELLLILGIISYGFISKTLFSAILISIGLFSSVCYSI
jgi:NADH-quinone oxidoreductase subunit M